ncbi:MAG: EAL domain-containing protein [Anaerovorax sp.]|nr:EAL domain-containing protein [Anaerovorax sp.]
MKKFHSIYIKSILKIYLIIVIPFLLLSISFYSYLSEIEIEKAKEIIIGEQKQRAAVINYIMQDIFNELNENLYVIRNSNETNNYLNQENQKNFLEAEQLLLRIANNKKSFDQIRFINRNGKEVIRVNNGSEGAYLVPQNELQDKSDRYYYEITSKLNEGEIFISDMDLNKENGEVEVPYKPMIRIAAPLYSSNHTYRGILIVNYLGDDLLSVFHEQFKNSEYSFIEPAFLNKDGYYLFDLKKDKTFGFMFQDKVDSTLAVEQPKLWNQIKQKENGYYQKDNNIVFFMKVNPLAQIKSTENIELSWYIVSSFNLESLPIVRENIIFGMKFRDILMIAGICILMFIIVLIYYISVRDKEQLNITNRIADNINDAVIITDRSTRIIYANYAFEKITGYKTEEVLGLKTNYFKSNKQSPKFYKEMWNNIIQNGHWQGELWDKKKDGMLYPKKLNIYAIYNKSNQTIEKYIGIFSDLTKRKEEQEYVNKLQDYNITTNLPNENLFLRLLDNNIRDNKKNLKVVYFSIQNYNSIVLNIKEEDPSIIHKLINRISAMLTGDDFIAQITKNNFVIGLSSIINQTEMDEFIETFFEKSREAIHFNQKEIYLDIKAGISKYPLHGTTSHELMRNAYFALENAIEEKEKKYLYYDFSLKEKMEEEIELRSFLIKAISNNELEVVYQPQVNIVTERVTGAEALLRWENHQLGKISPNIFIPLAEKTGQIIEIGYWVIERVFQDYQLIKYKLSNDFRVSINISALQFKDPELLKKMQQLAEKYEVDFKNIEIEITESILMTNINSINDNLKKFKALGVTIAIDDFGTGFSSLSYLKNLHVDKLKIDRSFIKEYPENDNGEIAQVITNIASKLKLDIITEGAETKEQIEYLKSIGCNYVQGYYYSPPLERENFYQYLMKKNTKD